MIHYKKVPIEGVSIFYREAGEPKAPAVLLLHGFPTSSRMFRNLIPALADRYHLIAPDYPGFGQSPAPDAFPTPSRPTPSWSRDSRTRSGSSGEAASSRLGTS